MKTHFKSNLVITELLVLGGRGISSISKCNKRKQIKSHKFLLVSWKLANVRKGMATIIIRSSL